MVLSPRGMDDAHPQTIDDIVVAFVEMMSRKVVIVRGEEGLEGRIGRQRGISNDGEQQSNFCKGCLEHCSASSRLFVCCMRRRTYHHRSDLVQVPNLPQVYSYETKKYVKSPALALVECPYH
jgi:hypothetical protein